MAEQDSALVFETKEKIKKELALPDPLAIGSEAKEISDPGLDNQAEDVVARILRTDLSSAQEQEKAKVAMESMGVELQRESARRSAMLKQPIAKLMKDSEDGGQVAKSLIDLKLQVEDLDPAKVNLNAGFLARIIGYIPGVGTPLKRYFSRYESASTSIDAIINSLESGREQLKRDNITLTDDQAAMYSLTRKLEKTIELARLIDNKLQAKIGRAHV